MSNDLNRNTIVALSRNANGTLSPLASFPTGGRGASLDTFDGIDPLISGFAVTITPDNRFILAVNGGSRSLSVFRILSDFSLRRTAVSTVAGYGPVSVAYSNGIVYVASASRTPIREGFFRFELVGLLTGFRLSNNGRLTRIGNSVRNLTNRPAAVQFTPDGRSLVVASVSAGAGVLNRETVEELVVYRVLRNGMLSQQPVSTATSTERNNRENRNLPNAIGIDIATINGVQYVAVTEARAFRPNGVSFSSQTSSVSIWSISSNGNLQPTQLDILVGNSVTTGERATCWIEFSRNEEVFWVSNTASGTISAFTFKNGRARMVQQVAARAAAPIDLWRSSDGRFLYQLSPKALDAFRVAGAGSSPGLRKIQTITSVPDNVQGIVAV